MTITPPTIRNLDDQLVSYSASLADTFIEQSGCGPLNPDDPGTPINQSDPAPQTGVHINNQFGPLQLNTADVREICIPSQKTLPAP